MKRKLFALAILGMAFALNSSAQDNNEDKHSVEITIPEVAILDLEASKGTSITLAVTAPTEAGLPVSFKNAKDSTVWINYSSIVGSKTEPSREVSAKIASGNVPDGMLLKVTASSDAGNGDGQVGASTGEVTLDGKDQMVIGKIGSCYTGNGVKNGHALYYSLELDPSKGSYANLDFDQATTLTILYTISNK